MTDLSEMQRTKVEKHKAVTRSAFRLLGKSTCSASQYIHVQAMQRYTIETHSAATTSASRLLGKSTCDDRAQEHSSTGYTCSADTPDIVDI
jgi:hypothetical protein